jgi:hypothetical protein
MMLGNSHRGYFKLATQPSVMMLSPSQTSTKDTSPKHWSLAPENSDITGAIHKGQR